MGRRFERKETKGTKRRGAGLCIGEHFSAGLSGGHAVTQVLLLQLLATRFVVCTLCTAMQLMQVKDGYPSTASIVAAEVGRNSKCRKCEDAKNSRADALRDIRTFALSRSGAGIAMGQIIVVCSHVDKIVKEMYVKLLTPWFPPFLPSLGRNGIRRCNLLY